MIVFSSPGQCPYLNAFPLNFTNWSSYDSTLIYISTSTPLTINSITANGVSVIGSAFWQTGTSWITGWPITIPSNQHAVIQVNQQASNIILQTDNGTITLKVTNGWNSPLTSENSYGTPTTIFTPNAGNYLIAMNIATGFNYGNLSVNIDDQTFVIDINSQYKVPVLMYKYIGPINLNAGYHTITVSEGNRSSPTVESILLYSLEKE